MIDPLRESPDFITGCVEFVAGFIFFSIIFYSFQTFFRSSSLGKVYCDHFNISYNGIFDISNKLTSSVFAVCACLIGWFVNRQCSGDIMRDRHPILDNYMVFTMAYFLYDIFAMFVVFSTDSSRTVSVSKSEVMKFVKERPLMIFHHILVPTIIICLLLFRNGIGDCLIGTVLLLEASTPFVSFRAILVQLNLKESGAYIVNGLLMVISFFLCRVVLLPYLYLWYANTADLSMVSTMTTVPWFCHLFTLAIWVPQLIWFQKMLLGSIKLFKKKKRNNNIDKSD